MGQEDNDIAVDLEPKGPVPVLPLRDVVVYPHMVIPLFVGRDKSIQALDAAMKDNKQILLVAQKSADTDDPTLDDMYQVGTLANILQLLKLPDGTVKVLVEGGDRSRIVKYISTDDYFSAKMKVIKDILTLDEREIDVLMRSATTLFDQYVKLNEGASRGAHFTFQHRRSEPPCGYDGRSYVAKTERKQEVLEMADISARLEHLMGLMESENDLLQIESASAAGLSVRWKRISASTI